MNRKQINIFRVQFDLHARPSTLQAPYSLLLSAWSEVALNLLLPGPVMTKGGGVVKVATIRNFYLCWTLQKIQTKPPNCVPNLLGSLASVARKGQKYLFRNVAR